MAVEKMVADMLMVGGHVCLDFVNTVDSRRGRWGPDLLRTYGDLISWAERVEIIEPDIRSRLRAKADIRPVAARSALTRAKVLREAIYGIFQAEARDGSATPSDLQTLGSLAIRSYSQRVLSLDEGRPTWSWRADETLDAIIYRVALVASELAVGREHRRKVQECKGPNCGWLFIDTSRGGRRLWCSETTCGTRSRVRRFRAKLQAER